MVRSVSKFTGRAMFALAVCLLLAAPGAASAGVWQIDMDHSVTPILTAGWSSVTRPEDGSGTSGQYSSGVGYGWLSPAGIAGRERASGTTVTRDFHFDDAAQTFLIDMDGPNVLADVTLYIYDTSYTHDRISVWVEGTKFVDQVASNTTQNFQVAVTDGQLTLVIGDEGGSDPNWVLAGIEVTTTPVPEPATLALLGLGGVGLAARRLRRRR